ncbi:UDP-N-acetylenolpyruvoylglucosamine reductase [bioreactor metagenome]|uniref:UDP-N-acetylmuramate dehydrogenase n=1 Tax=bioreactor metagenome TaxID=1076179 RepID=A0A644WFE9_9ZZZZ
MADIETPGDLLNLQGAGLPEPLFCLGQGSNLLFTHDFEGTLIRMLPSAWEVISHKDDEVVIRAEAGCIWDELVEQTLKNGCFGLENLSLIPGTVGSSPVQNIGAYGSEAAEFIVKVHVFDCATNQFFDIENRDCDFGYRQSIFKSKPNWIVVSVDYRLSTKKSTFTQYRAVSDYIASHKLDGQNPIEVRQAVIAIRESKLPDYKITGNAGSFFRNPVVDKVCFDSLKEKYPEVPFYSEPGDRYKIPAAWLIEKTGWKGFKGNHAGVHDKQPLILVNLGGATGLEIKMLAEEIQTSIKNNFGIQLHPEVIYL